MHHPQRLGGSDGEFGGARNRVAHVFVVLAVIARLSGAFIDHQGVALRLQERSPALGGLVAPEFPRRPLTAFQGIFLGIEAVFQVPAFRALDDESWSLSAHHHACPEQGAGVRIVQHDIEGVVHGSAIAFDA